MDPYQKVIYSIIEKFIKGRHSRKGEIGVLVDALGLGPREMVSLVGAGGKTTLMFRLAKELSSGGRRVLTTTTTRILEPSPEETPCLFVDSEDERVRDFVLSHLDQCRHITIAGERAGAGKLKGISPVLATDLWNLQEVDYLIVEADGAARRPVKAPREGEPVIPLSSTLVVAVLGMDGLGRELNEENAFQAERVSQLTGIPVGARMTAEAMASLMIHPQGLFKGSPVSSRAIALLNKVDVPDGMKKAREVAEKILKRRDRRIERVVLAQLRAEPPVSEVIFP